MVGQGKRRAGRHTCGETLREGKDRKEGTFGSVSRLFPGVERQNELTFRAPLALDGSGYA